MLFRSLDAELAELRVRVDEARQVREEKLKTRRASEKDLQSAQEKRDGLMGKLHAIKTNREYTAALQEIETAKEEISRLEDKILALLDEVEMVEEDLRERERVYSGEEKEIHRQQDERRKELQGLERDLAQRREEREKSVARVPAGLLARYEKIRLNKNGTAVVALEDGICGGCFRRLPPQVDLEIRRGEEIQYCQFCGRMLHLGAARSTGA